MTGAHGYTQIPYHQAGGTVLQALQIEVREQDNSNSEALMEILIVN